MIELPIFDQTGQKVETLQVDEAKLGGEVRRNLLKQAIVAYHTNQRQGTVQTLAAVKSPAPPKSLPPKRHG